MEAKNVKIYYNIPNNLINNKEFYNLYLDSYEQLDLSEFFNSIADDSNNEYNKIYGMISGERKEEYYTILTFLNTRNNKQYIIYTDNKLDEYEKLKIYSAIYDEDDPKLFISYPSENEEWVDISLIIDSLFFKNI